MNPCAFLLTSLIIILIPGTGVIYTVSVGMSEGRGESVFAALGCTAGILPHLGISLVLSALLMQMDDNVFSVVKYIGVLYLMYLGVGMIVGKGTVEFSEERAESRASAIIRRGILINLLHPKLTLFFFPFSCNMSVPTAHITRLGVLCLGFCLCIDLSRVCRVWPFGWDSKGMALPIA